MRYTRIINLVYKANKGALGIDVEKQKKYIEKLGQAHDDYERSYKQYLCQMKFYPITMRIVINLASFFAMPIYVILLWIKYIIKPVKLIEQHDTIIDHNNRNEVLPDSYLSKNNPYFGDWNKNGIITSSDFVFIWNLLKRTHSPFLTYKCSVKISKYRNIIESYRPKTITVFSEYSFTSSIMTLYCEQNGVAHVNVMHGEKFYFIRDSYFRFSECYVWMDYYKNLFISMFAEPNQFIIDLPPSLKCDTSKYNNPILYADYKYYLANDTEDEIKIIAEAMVKLKERGHSVKFRPHPTYSDMSIVRKYVCEDEIEKPQEVNIFESISNMKCAVGGYSTVLLQAYCAGKETLIDDLSNPVKYERLQKVKYIMLHHANGLLSEVAGVK